MNAHVTIGSRRVGDIVTIDLESGQPTPHVDASTPHPFAARAALAVFRWLGLYVKGDILGVEAGPFDVS